MTSSPRVAYIAGYGRSGSTLLDIILHSHPATVSVGALHNYPRTKASDGRCGCGELLSTCPFWISVEERAEATDLDAFLETQLRVERRTRLPLLLLNRTSGADRDRYRRDHLGLLHAIATVGQASVVVDSSKSAGETLGRPLALRRILGLDVRVIHLVRQPRDVLRSVLSGSGSGDKPASGSAVFLMGKTAVQWSLVNLGCQLLYRGDQVVRLRYEDLLADPDGALRRIGELLELDLSDAATRIGEGVPFQPGHNLGGNRLKQQAEVVVQAQSSSLPPPSGAFGSVFDLLTFPARALLRVGAG